ncbi:hypothetical protein G7066_11530 [Leucobacter coleopterorum]|uniref:Transposase IS4 N-terminal domain-containing protein n=1 Tax=Leucobacter coleopterorum TaxID=2714933 RepID=A0ABX6K1Y0_9MICO|nr:transposase domain-containing protein [Leucobacter coleopterorum]QIM19040.1 hypothetical protein G7066_11530 [Leucobacter coleopterorum]
MTDATSSPIAGALYTGHGWQHVWSRLTASLTRMPKAPAKSALTEAMRRVSPRPLRELFTLVAGPAPPRSPQR